MKGISCFKQGVWKKVVAVILFALLFGIGSLTPAYAYSLDAPTVGYEDYLQYDGIKVFINGRYVEFNDSMGYPYAENGTTMIPLRAVAETFNANVGWNSWWKMAYVDKHGKEVNELC